MFIPLDILNIIGEYVADNKIHILRSVSRMFMALPANTIVLYPTNVLKPLIINCKRVRRVVMHVTIGSIKNYVNNCLNIIQPKEIIMIVHDNPDVFIDTSYPNYIPAFVNVIDIKIHAKTYEHLNHFLIRIKRCNMLGFRECEYDATDGPHIFSFENTPCKHCSVIKYSVILRDVKYTEIKK